MVTLEQIRQLDARVHRAVEVIAKLREENTTLKDRLTEYQGRIEELEVLISNFKEDQSEIEHGITSALSQLAAIDESGKPVHAAAARKPDEPPKVHAPVEKAPEIEAPPSPAEPDESVGQLEEDETEEGADEDAELDIF
jgi:chromosome segregation ATPase